MSKNLLSLTDGALGICSELLRDCLELTGLTEGAWDIINSHCFDYHCEQEERYMEGLFFGRDAQ